MFLSLYENLNLKLFKKIVSLIIYIYFWKGNKLLSIILTLCACVSLCYINCSWFVVITKSKICVKVADFYKVSFAVLFIKYCRKSKRMLATPKGKGGLFLASSLCDGLEDNNIRQEIIVDRKFSELH